MRGVFRVSAGFAGEGQIVRDADDSRNAHQVRLDDLTAVRIPPHRKLPTPSMKIYHVKGTVPSTHMNIAD